MAKTTSSLEIGFSTIAVGAALCIILPEVAIPGYLILGMGGICVFDYFTHISKFDKVFRALKLGVNEAYPILKRKKVESNYVLYEFTLPAGMSTDMFDKKKVEIEQFLGQQIEINYGFRNLLIRAYTDQEKTEYKYNPIKLKGNVPILIGYDREGNLQYIDLAEDEPHMYIAGTTGCGKSTALRVIITNLILFTNVELYLLDLKSGVEFGAFKNCKNVVGFASTKAGALSMLTDLEKEVDKRYSIFADEGVENIRSYNQTHSKKMKYKLLIVDEFSNLMYEKESTIILETLASKARACGVHMCLSTQRPDYKVLNGRIKANITNILGMRTQNGQNSEIVLDRVGLEKLRGKGHGILKCGLDETIIQMPNLALPDAKELLKPFIVDKKQTKPEQSNSVQLTQIQSQLDQINTNKQVKPELNNFDFFEDL